MCWRKNNDIPVFLHHGQHRGLSGLRSCFSPYQETNSSLPVNNIDFV